MPRRITSQLEGLAQSGTCGEPVSKLLSTHRVNPYGLQHCSCEAMEEAAPPGCLTHRRTRWPEKD